MLELILLANWAAAHSSSFGPTKLRSLPGSTSELWAVAEGWGVLYSSNGGEEWGWICEEKLATTTVYDVAAWSEGVALAATTTGIVRIDTACGATPLAGLPEGFVLTLERWGTHVAAGWIGNGEGGIYRCSDTTCEPTAWMGPAYFPKSMYADGDTLWATSVHTDTLKAELVRLNADDAAVTHEFPNGDSDPRVVYAAGENVHLWVRPRTDTSVPDYRLSSDGGTTFESTFSTGFYTDPAPGVVVRDEGETVLLGSYYGARTWRSDNGGLSFAEVTDTAPSVRCGLDLGGRTLVCADHLADGFDVAESSDGRSFTPLACFEEVVPLECAAEACDAAYDAWVTAAAYGGGKCEVVLDSADVPPETPPCGCNAGSGATAGIAAALVGLLRRKKATKRT